MNCWEFQSYFGGKANRPAMGACMPPKQRRSPPPEDTEKFVLLLHKLHYHWSRLNCDCKRCREFVNVLRRLNHIDPDVHCPFSQSIDYFVSQPFNRERTLYERHRQKDLERRMHNSSRRLNIPKENQAPKNEIPPGVGSKEDFPAAPSKGEVVWVRFIDTKSNCAYYRNNKTGQVTWNSPKAAFATDVSALSTHDLSTEHNNNIKFIAP